MKKFIEVERLGDEVSVYSGFDGHYTGTTVVGYKKGNIFDIVSPTTKVKCYTLRNNTTIICVDDIRIVEPITHNIGIKVWFSIYDLIIALGWYLKGDSFENYSNALRRLNYEGITIAELKEVIESL